MNEAGGEGLGDQQSAAVAGGQVGGIVEQGSRIEHSEHLWVGHTGSCTKLVDKGEIVRVVAVRHRAVSAHVTPKP